MTYTISSPFRTKGYKFCTRGISNPSSPSVNVDNPCENDGETMSSGGELFRQMEACRSIVHPQSHLLKITSTLHERKPKKKGKRKSSACQEDEESQEEATGGGRTSRAVRGAGAQHVRTNPWSVPRTATETKGRQAGRWGPCEKGNRDETRRSRGKESYRRANPVQINEPTTSPPPPSPCPSASSSSFAARLLLLLLLLQIPPPPPQ